MNKIKYALQLVCWVVVTVTLLPLALLLASLASFAHRAAEKVDLLFEWLVFWKGKLAPLPLTVGQKTRLEASFDEDL